MLHLADDAAEHPEVAAENAGLVHQPERVRLAARRLQDLHEGGVIRRVAPELRVHQVARVVERAKRPRREPLRPDRLLVDEEGLEDGVRIAFVEIVARDLEHAALLEEFLGDRPHRRVLQAGDALLDVEHQDLVELRHRLGRPVVAPHQPLRRALAAERAVAEALGDGGLQVEHQAVLAPAGDRVQAGADQLEHALVALQLAHLEGRDQAVRGELLPLAAETAGARDPDDRLQVAQAARTLLAIGLERVGRVLEFLVALAHLERLGAQERLRVHRLRGRALERLEHLARTAQEARFEQRRLHRHVRERDRDAFVDGANARADLEAGVPAGGDEALGRGVARLVVRPGRRRQQDEHVDVGIGKQLAAAIAADGDEGGVGRHAGLAPELAHRHVDVLGEGAQQAQRGARGRPCGHEARQPLGLGDAKASPHLRRRARHRRIAGRIRRGRGGDRFARVHAAASIARR